MRYTEAFLFGFRCDCNAYVTVVVNYKAASLVKTYFSADVIISDRCIYNGLS